MTLRARVSGPLLLLLASGCASLGGGPADPADAARRQARQMYDASMKRDYARAFEFTYPAAVEAAGGRERMIEGARALFKEMDDNGARWHSTTVGRPTQIVSEGGTMYAVVPTTIEWSFQGREMPGSSYVLGVSTDGGKRWMFVDGVALAHPALRRKVFPSLPPSLVLPIPALPGLTTLP